MKTKATTTLIIVGLLLVASAAAFWWLSVTIYQTSTDLRTVLQTLKNEQVMARDQEVLVSLLESTEADRTELQSYVIAGESGTIFFLSEIDTLAANLDITLETSNLTVTPGGRAPYNALVVGYSFKGSDANVRTFLTALENVPYAGELTSIELTKRAGDQEGGATIDGTVVLELSMMTP